jgi:hypothetical protein
LGARSYVIVAVVWIPFLTFEPQPRLIAVVQPGPANRGPFRPKAERGLRTIPELAWFQDGTPIRP